MKKSIILILAACGLAIAWATSQGLSGIRSVGADPYLSSVGTVVTPSGQAAELMARAVNPDFTGSVTGVDLLSSQDGRGLYRIETERSTGCYAARPAGAANGLVTELTIVVCPIDPAFPSAEQPLLDLSVRNTAGGKTYLSRIEGFAADGVASIDLLRADGSTISTILVRDNTYEADTNATSAVTSIVARDDAGNEVARR